MGHKWPCGHDNLMQEKDGTLRCPDCGHTELGYVHKQAMLALESVSYHERNDRLAREAYTHQVAVVTKGITMTEEEYQGAVRAGEDAVQTIKDWRGWVYEPSVYQVTDALATRGLWTWYVAQWLKDGQHLFDVAEMGDSLFGGYFPERDMAEASLAQTLEALMESRPGLVV